MIAKMLTQENITAILGSGTIGSSAGNLNVQRLTEIDSSQLLQTLKRISPVKPVEFLVLLGGSEKDGGVSIHFEGNGWKLSGIQLPIATVQVLAEDLANSKGETVKYV